MAGIALTYKRKSGGEEFYAPSAIARRKAAMDGEPGFLIGSKIAKLAKVKLIL
jgi:hypothetical protein